MSDRSLPKIALARRHAVAMLAFALAACGGSPPPPAPAARLQSARPNAFDKAAAAAALEELQEDASRCASVPTPNGEGHMLIVFESSGTVAEAKLDDTFAATPAGACVERVFRSAKVPPFQGLPEKAGITFFVAPMNAAPGFSARNAKALANAAITHCALNVRGREVGADEIKVAFKQDGSVASVAFFRFEDHGALDESDATKCIRTTLKGGHVPAFSSNEERANVRVYFSRGN